MNEMVSGRRHPRLDFKKGVLELIGLSVEYLQGELDLPSEKAVSESTSACWVFI